MRYLKMTKLPEDLERGLLDLGVERLLPECPGWLAVSDPYQCVQRLAIEHDEKALRTILARAAGKAPTSRPVRPTAQVVANGAGWIRAEGRTRVSPESMRGKVLALLSEKPVASDAITASVGFNSKPHLSKLEEAGWAIKI